MSAIRNPGLPQPAAPIPEQPAPPAAPPDRGRPWKWIPIAGLIGGGALTAWMMWLPPAASESNQGAGPLVTVKTTKVTTGDVVRTIRLAGQTTSGNFVNVVAPTLRGQESGKEMILLYLIPSGIRVKKGQLLAQIDAKTAEDHIEDVADEVERAEADIRKRAAEQTIDLENLQQQIRVSKAEAEKARWEANATEVRTPIDQELLKLAADEAETRYKEIASETQYKQAVYSAEMKILEITKQRQMRHLGRHKGDLNWYSMHAAMDGLAVVQPTYRAGEWSLVRQGDQVMSGQIFAKVVNPAKMQVEGSINQSESGQYRLGQRCLIQLDAFGGLKFGGRIFSIAAIATGGFRQNNYIRNIPIKVAIEGSANQLIPDLSASVDVEIARAAGVKQIPLAAVFRDGDKDVVYVKGAKGFDKRAVTLGLKSGTHAEVSFGLEGGEEVALEVPVAAA